LNEQKKITAKKAILYEGKELPRVNNEQGQSDAYFINGKALLSEKVTTLTKPLNSDLFHETELSLMLCRALREWCQTDCAMINTGLLLGPLKGDVTVFDLLKICPHPINPCVVELTGKELEEVFWQTKDEALVHKHIKGLGFRGTLLGVFVFDRISIYDDIIFINGTKVDHKRNYTLALPDMFTFGHFFKDILPQKEKQYFLPEFLRDILRWKLQLQS
jgi:2',3'-cyclic-nucleotide 2'-phosphodiesterase (5'-nucleotidase family)